jgi:hypothetical protein
MAPGTQRREIMIKNSWKRREFILAWFAITALAPPARASVISIDDSRADDRLLLRVARPNTNTRFNDGNDPGVGNLARIDPPLSADDRNYNRVTNNISDVTYDRAAEKLLFTFTGRSPWNADVYKYRYYKESDISSPKSDLIVIQGLRGSRLDVISFYSDVPGGTLATTASPPTTLVPRINGSTATPLELATFFEDGRWAVGFDTNVDQYYVHSDNGDNQQQKEIPEPSSLIVFGIGMVALCRCVKRGQFGEFQLSRRRATAKARRRAVA